MTPANEISIPGERQTRRGQAFHPVLLEVAGCMEDEIVREVTQRLRNYRNRYTPLLRCVFTLVAASMPESHLFGDYSSSDNNNDHGKITASSSANGKTLLAGQGVRPLFTAPPYAVSVNKTYPLVHRFYPSAASINSNVDCSAMDRADNLKAAFSAVVAPSLSDTSAESLPVPSEVSTLTVTLPWVDFCASVTTRGADVAAAVCRARAVQRLEDFMAFHFLPFAMTHNNPAAPSSVPRIPVSAVPPTLSLNIAAASVPSTERTFVLRHYVNEASRTASFLFADPYHAPCDRLDGVREGPTLQAVLVDPREEQAEAYFADLAAFSATLTCVIFTHCYVDGSAGLRFLIARFPALRIVSGLPLAPAGTACTMSLSAFLTLRTVAVPAFSPECLLVEVHAGRTLVGLCTGVLWSTDAAPRWDLLQWTPYPAPPLPQQSKRFASLVDALGSEEEERGAGAAAAPYGGGDRDAALAHTHCVLREFFFQPYLSPLCSCGTNNEAGSGAQNRDLPPGKSAREDEENVGSKGEQHQTISPHSAGLSRGAVDALQRVVMLPTHGGYNNVTNQLDLYWAIHLGDLCRMKHARTVIDTLAADANVFVKYNKRIPRLPHPPLFDASRVFHLRQLLEYMDGEQRAHCLATLPADMRQALTDSFKPYVAPIYRVVHGSRLTVPPPRAFTSYVNVVDVRDAKDYHALHLSGSVNVPMSFPGVAYGARRAELWLQCVLVPHQPILALCAAAAQKAEVQRRLTALSPGCAVAVFSLEDLPPLATGLEHTGDVDTKSSSSSEMLPWREIHCRRPAGLPAELPVPQQLVWIQHTDALVRLTTYEHLVAIEPTDTRVVLDVRTPYEFKNGSHQHSVHVELSEMCMLAVKDVMQTYTPAATQNISNNSGVGLPLWHVGSSPRLADVYMEKMHTTALMAGLPVVRQEAALSDIVIYCAGGYRSLIAVSLMQRAVEASTNPAWHGLHITDVSGGAFQIMTQRPDLWRVKDRSIICIS